MLLEQSDERTFEGPGFTEQMQRKIGVAKDRSEGRREQGETDRWESQLQNSQACCDRVTESAQVTCREQLIPAEHAREPHVCGNHCARSPNRAAGMQIIPPPLRFRQPVWV